MPGLLQPDRELTWSSDDRLIRARVKSFFTQKWNEMECDPAHPLAVTRAQYDAWQAGQHIQHAMPQLSDEEREFLLTGATPEEWDAEFGGEDEDGDEVDACEACGALISSDCRFWPPDPAVPCKFPRPEEPASDE